MTQASFPFTGAMPKRPAQPPRIQRYRGLDEERTPCGRAGILHFVSTSAPFDPRRPDISDCLVSLPKPFIIVIWEPLHTKAPAPPKARPYCCYIRTVIFYCSPYIQSPWVKLYRIGDGPLKRNSSPGHFEEWDQIETRLSSDDIVEVGTDQFVIGGGSVRWAKSRWWMMRIARRRGAP